MQDNESRFDRYKKNALEFLRERGYYVVLVVCLAAIGVTAAFLLGAPTVDEPLPEKSPYDQSASSSSDERLKNVPLPTATPVPSASPTATLMPDFTPKPSSKGSGTTPPKAPAPVEGSVVWNFAVDSLLYSKTLDQWTTHSGVDIACKPGTPVRAVIDGTVDEVYTDDHLGVTVVLAHSEKRKSVYANLAEDPSVKPGDKIRAGDTLGATGSTAISECAEEPHLHFEFIVGSEYVNPMNYILLSAKPK